jgi:hypothetical protein
VTVDRGLSIAFFVLSCVLALFLFRAERSFPQPAFLVDPTQAAIVSSQQDVQTDLSVLFRGRVIPEQNVTATRIYFWNAGKLPIKNSDVLVPLEIKFPAGGRVLSVQILDTTRKLNQINVDLKDTQTIDINFRILEHGDGATFQVIHAGPPSVQPYFEGSVVGAAHPTVEKARSVSPKRAARLSNALLFTASVLSILIAMLATRTDTAHISAGPGFRRFAVAMYIVSALMFFVVGIHDTFWPTDTLSQVPYALRESWHK